MAALWDDATRGMDLAAAQRFAHSLGAPRRFATLAMLAQVDGRVL
jgi:hypothetical protein